MLNNRQLLLRVSLFIYPLIVWFLWDIVIYSTIVSNVCVYLFFFFGKPISSKVKNGLLIFMGGAIWFYYGRWIDPEIGVNFLLGVISLKFAEQNAPRDQLILFFGMILLLGVGMLFEKSLFYFGFVLVSLGLLFWALYRDRRSPFRLKSLASYLFLTAPLTILLFIVFPRALSPFFYRPTPPSQGEVGYTSEVKLTDIQQLSFNSRVVFQAEVAKEIASEKLYWRGNTISNTDGWNWSTDYRDRLLGISSKNMERVGTRQVIKSVTTEDFMFGLDRPSLFVWSGMPYAVDAINHSRPQERFSRVSNYVVYSATNKEDTAERFSTLDQKYMTRLPPMRKNLKERLLRQFKSETPKQLTLKIREHFIKQQFNYSLSPGLIENFEDFWYNKKIGFCSHFASATALILRVHGIPTRLVSGFLGGEFNPYTNIYKITQNDAHVWVESYIDGKWLRIDPVEWIAPDRIALGGGGYVEQVLGPRERPWMTFLPRFKNAAQWIEQWNVKFYNLIENYDRQSQLELANSLEIDLKRFYSILPVIVLLIGVIGYVWQKPFWRRKKRNLFQKASDLMLQSLQQKGRKSETLNFAEIYEFVNESNLKNKPELQNLISQFETLVFREEDYTDLNEWMRKFKKLI